jgi:hypothetical protein
MAEHPKATTDALNKIGRLNLRRMVAKTAKDYGWTEGRADTAELWYKNFLKICYLNSRKPVAALTRDADLLWHQHILDTVRYQKDCNRIFHRYLNHVPLEGRATPADKKEFDASVKMYIAEFGDAPKNMKRVCLAPPPKPPGPPPPPPRPGR